MLARSLDYKMISRASLLSLSGAILLAICLQGRAQTAQTCGSQRTCGDCISTPDCAWCTDMNFNGTRRCSLVNATSSCTVVENPSGSVGAQTVRNTDTGEENPLNLTNIDLNLRVGEELTFPVQVTALRNLPLDLYILMDLSSSMGPVLQEVQGVAEQITVRIRNITDNVRLGFGSFNDKNLVPFTNPEFTTVGGESPYAFLHRIDFTNNAQSFGLGINAAITTSNADSAENTLEALAQVISCDSVLGWRSRNNTQVARLILVLTDQGFHYSGEGKLAGILNPYEGQCLLNRLAGLEQIELFNYDEFDYPSVGQIVDLIRSQEVNVIFSVATNVQPTYQELVSLTNQRATVAQLGGGQEILDTIAEEYARLLRAISLEQLDPTDQFTIRISAACPPGSNPTADGMACNDVQLDDQVLFTVSVTLNSCDGLSNGESKVLRFESRAFGTFSVTVRGVCQCDCEEDEVPDAFQCSGNGVFSCGVCVCNEGYCGSNCSLLIDPSTGGGANNCPVGGPGLFQGLLCSGRGDCDCVCDCNDGMSGDACECDDTAASLTSVPCRSTENELCSGRGACCNQMCDCGNSPMGNPYRGNDTHELCQCEPVEEVCNYMGVECNGEGTCGCDRCDCNSEWSGDFCEIPRSTRCVGETIDTDCISQCRTLLGTPERCDVEQCNSNRPTLFVTTADIQVNTETAVEQFANRILNPTADFRISIACSVNINGCINNYYILDNGISTAVVVETEIECPVVDGLLLPPYVIAIISLAVLILLGILIIIIVKIIFVILDYVEVQRWRREAGEADFSKNQNPLYQSPEMQYTNIAYGKPL